MTIIPAYPPQAKGRVERRHGSFQDRLVKETRLRGIRILGDANKCLGKEFLPMINARYTVKARDPVDGHGPRPSADVLELALSWKETRTASKDWTVA